METESSSGEDIHHDNPDDNHPNDGEKEVSHRIALKVRAMASRASVTALEECMAEKFDHLEELITGLAGKSQKKPFPALEDAPCIAGFSTTDDSDSELSRVAKRKHKSRKQFVQSKFLEEGEVLSSFKSVILLQARTLLYVVEHGLDHHLKFWATKATAGSYKPEAFVGYDERVRQWAYREGISAFSDISREDVLLHFCHENVAYREKSKKKSEGAKKKS